MTFFEKLRSKLADAFFGLFKPPARIDPFSIPLRPEELEIVRMGAYLLTVQIRGRQPYYVPADERNCALVFDDSRGQYYLIRKVISRENHGMVRVEVRELHTETIKITSLHESLVFPKE